MIILTNLDFSKVVVGTNGEVCQFLMIKNMKNVLMVVT